MTSLAIKPQSRSYLPLVGDLTERAVLLVLFTRLLILNLHAVAATGRWFNWLMVTSEGLGVLFILLRRPAAEVSRRPSDWAFAFFATAFPLLVRSSDATPLAPPFIGVALLVLGLITQIAAKLSLRRSFGIAPANRGVKVGGPYRYVRHPMYAGYLMVHIGFLSLTPSLWNLFVYGVSWAAQIVRLLAEERLLAADPKYAAFQAEVRYRLAPGVF